MLERISFTFSRPVDKKRKPNEFYELCELAAMIYNKTTEKKVKPQRFMRDCKKYRKAYELARIDYFELKNNCSNAQEQAKLFFGCLKKRKMA